MYVNFRHSIFLGLLGLICGSTFDYNTTFVYESHGIMLKPRGLVSFASEEMISIFRKVKLPHLGNVQYCNQEWTKDFNAQITNSAYQSVDLFNKMVNPDHIPNRNKRSAALLAGLGLGLGAVDLIFGGISYGKLNNHINKLENDFNAFVSFQHGFDKKTVQFEETFVNLITKLDDEATKRFNELNCQIVASSGRLLAHQYLVDWENTLDALFKPIVEGNLKTSLTPEILDPSDLQQILQNHKMLSKTYFAKNLYSFYKVAEISVVQAHLKDKTLIVHQILHFPALTQQNLFPLMELHQVGLMRNGSCFFLDVPDYIYIKNDDFFSVDKDYNCKISNKPITSCYAAVLPNIQNNRCINDFSECRLSPVQCEINYIYDESGILVGSTNSEIQVFLKQNKHTDHSLTLLQPSKVGTIFINWTYASHIQMNDMLVEEPNFISDFIISNFSTEKVQSLIDSTLNLQFRKSFNASKLQTILNDQNTALNKVKSGHSTLLTICITVLVLAFLMLSICTITVFTKRIQMLPNCYSSISSKTDHSQLELDQPESETIDQPKSKPELHVIVD